MAIKFVDDKKDKKDKKDKTKKTKSKIKFVDKKKPITRPELGLLGRAGAVATGGVPQALGQLAGTGDVLPIPQVAPELGRFFTGAASGLAPRVLPSALGALGRELPQATTPGEQLSDVAGQITGLIAGPGQVAGKVAGKIPGVGFGADVLRGATGTGIIGGAGALLDPKAGFKEVAKGVGGGALLGGALTAAATPIRAALKLKRGATLSRVARTRGQFFNAKREAGKQFERGLDRLTAQNPKKAISLRQPIDTLKTEIGESTKLRSIINRTPQLKKLVNNPELAENLSLKEVQTIVNGIKSKIPTAKLKGVGIISDDIPVFDFLDDIKLNQLDAFPALAGVRAEYGKVLNDYNLIRSKIKVGSLQKAIEKNFGDFEVQDAVKRLLKNDPALLKELGGVAKTVKAVKTTKKILSRAAIGAGIGLGAGLGIGSMLQSILGGGEDTGGSNEGQF